MSEANENSDFHIGDTFIDVPKEYRLIAIRANLGKKSPTFFRTEWGGAGTHIKSTGERGLFGILLNQNYLFIERIVYYSVEITFQILEVDSRNLIYTCKDFKPEHEIEFSSCNVLFSGEIEEFLQEVKRYCTNEQYTRLFNAIGYKSAEVNESKKSPEKYIEYCLIILKRSQTAKAKSEMFVPKIKQ